MGKFGLSRVPARPRGYLETLADALCSPLWAWLVTHGCLGWSGKTSRAFSAKIAAAPSPSSSPSSPASTSSRPSKAGKPSASLRPPRPKTTACVGACLTLNMPEWTGTQALFPNGAAVSGLSRIAETGKVPQGYSMSPQRASALARVIRQSSRIHARAASSPRPSLGAASHPLPPRPLQGQIPLRAHIADPDHLRTPRHRPSRPTPPPPHTPRVRTPHGLPRRLHRHPLAFQAGCSVVV